MGALSKFKDIAAKAGQWLGLAQKAEPAPAATGAVRESKFDAITWRGIWDEAGALRELSQELNGQFDYTDDLVRDVFMSAYKISPEVRERAEMDPTRLVNHQIMTSLNDTPEMTELRKQTAGKPFGAAMATLSMETALREALERAREAAEKAAEAKAATEAARQAAADVESAVNEAEQAADEDGNVPDEQAAAVESAVAAAQAADAGAAQAAADAVDAVEGAAGAIRPALRKGLAQAEQDVTEEAELMAAWGVDPGQLERMSFAEREALAVKLRNTRLGKFTDLIGRFRSMATSARTRKVQHVGGERVGITVGSDLTKVLPSELAAMAVPVLRAELLVRYAQGQLLQFETEGEEETDRGGIVACGDCSYSMTVPGALGIPREVWMKALLLALLDQARSARPNPRDFTAILFSSAGEVEVFHFPADQDVKITDVIDMVEKFFGGGTDFATPLDKAMDVLEAEYNESGHVHGDVVFITDDECQVSAEWLRTYQERKAKLGFHTHGVPVEVPTGKTKTLEILCDVVRPVTELTKPDQARELFTTI